MLTQSSLALRLSVVVVLLALATSVRAEEGGGMPLWLQNVPREPTLLPVVGIKGVVSPTPTPTPSGNSTAQPPAPASPTPTPTPTPTVALESSLPESYSYASYQWASYDQYASYYQYGASSDTPGEYTPDMEYYSPGEDDGDGDGAAQFVYLMLALVVVLGGFAIVVIVSYFYEKNEEEASFF